MKRILEYENFNPEIHDSLKIAKLTYDIDFRTYDLFFRDSDSAIKTIRKGLKADDNLKVILDGGEIVGILLIFKNSFPNDFHFKSLRLFLIDILDYFVLCDIDDGDVYIANLAIDEKFRSQGLGRQVLCDVIEQAKKNNFKRVILDVDFRNIQAKKLYEKVGFKEFNYKQIKIAGFKRGMHNMEFNLE